MGQDSWWSRRKAAAGRKTANNKKHDQQDDVKRQIDSDLNDTKPIDQLVNLKTGGGKLIELIKARALRAHSSSQSSSSIQGSEEQQQQQSISSKRKSLADDRWLDEQICKLVKPLLYNGGRGKWVPLARLWSCRFGLSAGEAPISERGKQFVNDDEQEEIGADQNPSQRQNKRLVCWKLEERGFVGETALHICFLLSTPSHMQLAQKLLKLFPRLINDIYTCDEYFGESSLHMAIVNENVKIVKLLLDHGAEVHERCLGSFFLPHDQKARANQQIRSHLIKLVDEEEEEEEGEKFNLQPDAHYDLHSNQFSSLETNYEGYTYWGEYPLSFAASLGLIDCYKLLLAKGANPNRSDSNGNSTLHICVIANRLQMFDLCYSTGANLTALNKLGLSPLTLAAKLRRVEMFQHILTLQRQVSWIFCNVGFLNYSLQGIDSINTQTGACDDCSLLSIVVSGNSNEHLKMLDGLLSDLLQVKWTTSLRHRFRTWLTMFTIFLITATCAYITRFIPDDQFMMTIRSSSLFEQRATAIMHIKLLNQISELALIACVLYYLFSLIYFCLIDDDNNHNNNLQSKTTIRNTEIIDKTEEFSVQNHQLQPSKRTLAKTFAQAPELSIFTLTCLLILACIPLRLLGFRQYEDALASIIMFMLPLKLLFFCRGSKSLGSFIVMIYKILLNDVLCFFVFLVIFISGFAQSFVIVFKTYQPHDLPKVINGTQQDDKVHLSNLFESIVSGESHFLDLFDALITMHMMALNEFSWVLDEFQATDYPNLARILFCIYMILVSILLINMLIAMLGKTYQDISSQPNENLRQWARALLTLERVCSRNSRLKMLDKYSHLAKTGRYFSSTWALTGKDLNKINTIKQLKRDQAKFADR